MNSLDNVKHIEERVELCFKIAVFISQYAVDRYEVFK